MWQPCTLPAQQTYIIMLSVLEQKDERLGLTLLPPHIARLGQNGIFSIYAVYDHTFSVISSKITV